MTAPAPDPERRLELVTARYWILARSPEPWDQQHAADLAFLLERLGVELSLLPSPPTS